MLLVIWDIPEGAHGSNPDSLYGELEGSAVLSQEACGQVTMTLSSAILSFPSLYVTHDR